MQSKKQKKLFPYLSCLLSAMVFLWCAPFAAQAKVWLVGPDFILKTPSAAIKRAKDGDTIKIIAGIYNNDYAIIKQNNLTLVGIEGFAHLKSSGSVPGGKAIWVTKGHNITIRNIEFSGAKVADKNGAGIRLENGSLTIENGYFHDNQMGILSSNKPHITLMIRNSEFSRNILTPPDIRYPAHNIYIGHIAEFILENSISRGAEYGHAVKSRARTTLIKSNRIFDEGEIAASYLIDIPNGGETVIENNYLYKNKAAQNMALISYGAEGMKYKNNSLTIRSNTAINERGIAFLLRNHAAITAKITGNDITNISLEEIPGIERGGFLDRLKHKISDYFKKRR